MPLAVAGSPAAEVIAGKQEEAKRRRTEGIAGEMSGEAPAAFNTSQQRPPYSRKDALPAVPQDRVAPPCNPLNSHGNFNTSYRQLKPTAVPPVRTMATVRSRGNGAAPRDAVPLAVERRYDFPEFGCHLGKIGSGQRHNLIGAKAMALSVGVWWTWRNGSGKSSASGSASKP